MPRQRQYAADPTAKDQTAAARMRALRLRKRGHIEALCPVCSERFGRKVACPLFDGSTLAAAAKKEAARVRHAAAMRKLLGYDLIPEFVKATGITTEDLRYVTLRAAWRKHAAAIHPDRGGDPAVAAAFNELWERIRKSVDPDRAAKQAPWRVNWNTVEAHRPNVTPAPVEKYDPAQDDRIHSTPDYSATHKPGQVRTHCGIKWNSKVAVAPANVANCPACLDVRSKPTITPDPAQFDEHGNYIPSQEKKANA